MNVEICRPCDEAQYVVQVSGNTVASVASIVSFNGDSLRVTKQLVLTDTGKTGEESIEFIMD
jgi:hypothetical protein